VVTSTLQVNIQTICSQSVYTAITTAQMGFPESGTSYVDVMLWHWTPCYLPFGIPKHYKAVVYMTLANYVQVISIKVCKLQEVSIST
jgi:hypothetical protein